MIVSNLLGGLGNQMFQYACGRALSHRQGATFKIAIDMFRGYALHQGFELPRVFALAPAEATPDDLRSLLGWRRGALTRRVIAKLGWDGIRTPAFCLDPFFHFCPNIAACGPNAYLHGYFQSERYFEGAAAQIRRDFSFAVPLDGENAAVARRIADSASISVHLRRGDYVNDKRNVGLFAACGVDYYRRAIEHLLSRTPNARFFVFSDDPGYARELFATLGLEAEVVAHNSGADSYNDMRLMSLCRHHIIANSTFSWWGAWLNAREDKQVVAPARWFHGDRQPADLIPRSWVQL